MTLLERVPLASYCTLGVGGPARYFAEATDEAAVAAAVRWAVDRSAPLWILGGGSNLVIADDGVPGLVLRIAIRGVTTRVSGRFVELTAAAGEPWDDVVRLAVEEGWAGLECLSGIPGLVGATPIQNVGAYGQDVSQTVTTVRALDRSTGAAVELSPPECGFGYRDSLFRSTAVDRYVVLAVTYRLDPAGAAAVRYAELAEHLDRQGIRSPSIADVRRSVVAIRRSKSMVLDPADANRRSCGSFFVNPVVPAAVADRVEAGGGARMPRWPEPDGRVKLSAAWLIQQAGFARGHRAGPVGLSTRHALAVVCHEGATARDVTAFARLLRARVEERFGVRLAPEPVFWGAVRLD